MPEAAREAYVATVLDGVFDPMKQRATLLELGRGSRYYEERAPFVISFIADPNSGETKVHFFDFSLRDPRTRALIADRLDERLRQRGFGERTEAWDLWGERYYFWTLERLDARDDEARGLHE